MGRRGDAIAKDMQTIIHLDMADLLKFRRGD